MTGILLADVAAGPVLVVAAAIVVGWAAVAVGMVWGGVWLARRLFRRPDQPDLPDTPA